MFDQFCGLFQPLKGDDKGMQTFQMSSDSERMNGFIAYEDGYNWPDLYTEIDEMMDASILIYPLSELRRKVRQGEVKDESGKITGTPLTYAQVMDLVEGNEEELKGTQFAKEFYVEVLATLEERNMTQNTKAAEDRRADLAAFKPFSKAFDDREYPQGGTRSVEGFEADGTASEAITTSIKKSVHLTPSIIVAFDDQFENEELVYMIELNHARKRITVCFRGSVTKTDWATDIQIYMKEVPNPLKAHSTQEDTVRVHNGFYDYLFAPSSRGAKGPNGEDLSEYEEILQEHVIPVIKKYPGYKLYVTGHSLGAALATLFAFEAAAAPDNLIPKPVTLVSIAGPYVGDSSFRAAHKLLEQLGKLRHLRVSNHKDLVSTVPKFSFRWNLFDKTSHVGSGFKHVGINLKLYEREAPFELSYPSVRSGFFSSTYDEFARGWDQTIFSNFVWNPMDFYRWPAHNLREYSKRLENNKPTLEATYLNELYSRQDIVGYLVPQI